ncbi:MAG: enoyl-ACP reductase [Chloroflexota bacterium]
MAGILEGKTALVFGVANRRSIAWGIAQALAAEGATLAFTYQGERIEAGVRELAGSLGSTVVLPCDVTKDEDLDSVFESVGKELGGLDILIHAVAFAAREDLEGRFTDTKRSNFAMAMDISAYSLTAMVQRAEPMFEARGGGAVLAMTYLGGERAVPKYNVMGVAKSALDSSVRYLAMELGEKNIRVNAISAGPIRTLAARSISGFTVMEEHYEKRAPLRRNVDASEVGQTALFLCSPMSSGITGEIVHVDAGYHAIGF